MSAIDEAVALVRFDARGLVPAIVQSPDGRVLMLGYMNEQALRLTLSTHESHFFSRSRQRLWKKGETSGHVQRVRRVLIDCDGDTVLVVADQTGATCHEGYLTCFFREITDAGVETIEERAFDPETVYGK